MKDARARSGRATTRRGFLGAALGAGSWVLAGCRGGGRSPLARARAGADWDALADSLEGELLLRDAPGYEERRRAVQWNGRKATRRPEALVRAASVDDVQAAVRFAREAGRRVAVRGAGHSWCAAALREGGILVDLDRLRQVAVDPGTASARCQPAARGGELLAAALPHGLAFPVGHCDGVPLSGFLLSGGFGWNGGSWGPACASVEGVDAVDARGELVRADAGTNPELFWAARGAGPGFPGVVTGYRLRLHPAPRAIRTTTLTFAPDDRARAGARIDALRAALPPGVELTCLLLPETTAAGASAGARALVVSATAFADDEDQARGWLRPLEGESVPAPVDAVRVAETSFPALLASMGACFPRGRRYAADSFWSRSPSGEVLESLSALLAAAPSPESFGLCAPVPAPPPDAPPLPDMAFGLAAPVFAALYGRWRDAGDDEANRAWLREAERRSAALAAGHYVGESDLTAAPDRARRSFTPQAWTRLAEVRRKHDPEGRFFGFLGSDDAG